MKRLLFILMIALMAPLAAMHAQKAPSQADRQRWFKEMTAYKHEFIAKELNLSREQQSRFFPVYDEMDKALRSLNHEARRTERAIHKAKHKVTDAEYEKAAEISFGLRAKEGGIEQTYYYKFKDILTKEQLFKLKIAERKFTREVMEHRNRVKARRSH